MGEILDLQNHEPEETPAPEKGSYISLRICRNSFVSVAGCFVK